MKCFKQAAIIYKNENGDFVERTGKRHHEIIKAIHDDGETSLYKKWHVDGFIYGENWTRTFIDRDKATEIAKEMGIVMRGCVMTSEDLW